MTVAIIRCILCRTPWTTATSTCWIEVLHHKCRQSVAFSWVQISRCSLFLSFCWSLNLFCLSTTLLNIWAFALSRVSPTASFVLIFFCLHSVCWLSLLDYLTCMSSQDEGNIDWNALVAIMLVCFLFQSYRSWVHTS